MIALPARASILCLAVASAVLMGPAAPSRLPSLTVPSHGSTALGDLRPGELRVIPPGEPGRLPRGQRGATMAFHPSGAPVRSKARQRTPRVQVSQTGTNALEPTIGVDAEGRVFFMGGMDGQQWPLFPSQTMRTTDNGRTWDDVTPAPPQDHVTTEDPYLHVDEDTGRVFSSDFLLPCAAVSRSDDAGATWASTVTACDLLDHQTIFTGPPVLSQTVGYPNVVYYCASDYVGAVLGTSCLKSIDGGSVFVRTGMAPYIGDEATPQQCGWGTGHGVAGRDGTIYLPAGVCSQPTLAISRDEGATWNLVRVSDMLIGADLRKDHDAAVAVDSKNNLYYSWTGSDLKPYLSVSTDAGTTWSKPMMIAPPGVRIATLIALDVASPGNLAVAFVGSEDRSSFGEGRYSGYMMMTTEALSRDPLFYAGRINPKDDPIDGGCSTGSCSANREFIDVAIAPDGTVWAPFSDGCFDGSCIHQKTVAPFVGMTIGRGVAARLVGGPRLR